MLRHLLLYIAYLIEHITTILIKHLLNYIGTDPYLSSHSLSTVHVEKMRLFVDTQKYPI